jgi:hypothetical protein
MEETWGKYFKPSPQSTPIHLDELFLEEERGGIHLTSAKNSFTR